MPISVATPPDLAGLAPALRALVRQALALEGRRPGELGVVLAGDVLLRELNRDYRGLDHATDVLSFGYDESGEIVDPSAPARSRAGTPVVNGDIILSMDRVREQARRFRVSEADELARLVVHGALHLAGLDHQQAAERRAMRAREELVREGAATLVRTLARGLAAPRRAPRSRPPKARP
jgi:probable rRNA maturation factor